MSNIRLRGAMSFIQASATTALFTIAQSSIAQVNGPFVPPDGKKIMIVGQDTISIDGYRSSVGVEPAGVTSYIALADLSGLESYVDNGGGPNHASYLQGAYPNSIHAIAVYIKGVQAQAAGGQLDGNMERLANVLKGYGRPVLLRFGYEADGAWNSNDPGLYVQAFRRMHDKLASAGANNVAMVWQVASYCGGTYQSRPFTDWYPGDAYTDWLAFSYFTPQDCNNSAIDSFMNFARSKNKPVMIAESAPQRYDIEVGTYNSDPVRRASDVSKSGQQIWDEWFANYFAYIDRHSDYIRAVAFINADWDSQSLWAPPYNEGYWGDTRVQGNNLIQNNWVNEITGSDWLQSSSQLFAQLNGSAAPAPGNTPTPAPSPINTPAPNPVSGGSVLIEAENGAILGGASVFSTGSASNGQGVAYISSQGAGFSLMNVPASSSFRVQYASALSGQISLRVNGQDRGNISFNATGDWSNNFTSLEVSQPIPAGASVDIFFENGDTAMNVDYLEFNTQ